MMISFRSSSDKFRIYQTIVTHRNLLYYTGMDQATKQKLVAEAKKKLTEEQYNVCFLKGNEPPFSGKYYNNHDAGMYVCVVCDNPLFAGDTKFDSGTGWPSFWKMAKPG